MKQQRNYTLEWLKLIAACFVVLIHVKSPGPEGPVLNCLARFAVPFFFLCSGYFSFQISSTSIRRRLHHIFRLFAGSALLYFLWGLWKSTMLSDKGAANYLCSYFSVKNGIAFLWEGNLPSGMHLWFLTALLLCYLVLFLYTTFYKGSALHYRFLYVLGIFLLIAQLTISIGFPLVHRQVSYYNYRNGFLLGLPLFFLGLFLHEHQERLCDFILQKTKLSIFLLMLSIVLSLTQWFLLGKNEMPIGSMFEAVILFLFALCYPRLPFQCDYASFLTQLAGKMSIFIYVLHPLINYIIKGYQEQIPLFAFLREHLRLYPWVIMLLALIISFIFVFPSLYCKKKQMPH